MEEYVYVKDVLRANVIDPNVLKQEGVQDVWLTIQCRKLPAIMVRCVYRHPKAPIASFNYIQDVLKPSV